MKKDPLCVGQPSNSWDIKLLLDFLCALLKNLDILLGNVGFSFIFSH